MDRIDAKTDELRDAGLREDTENFNPADITDPNMSKIFSGTDDILQEVEYFVYLLRTDEIRDKNILKYYIPRVDVYLIMLEKTLESIFCKDPKRMSDPEHNFDYRLSQLTNLQHSMIPWHKYGLYGSPSWLDRLRGREDSRIIDHY
jgi:hypothetical protein